MEKPVVLTELTTSSQVLAKSGTIKLVGFKNDKNMAIKWRQFFMFHLLTTITKTKYHTGNPNRNTDNKQNEANITMP